MFLCFCYYSFFFQGKTDYKPFHLNLKNNTERKKNRVGISSAILANLRWKKKEDS